MIQQTGCAGVMIGRRALSDSWIFRDAHALLTTGKLPPPPTRIERTERMVSHFRALIDYLGERMAVVQFRKKISWYTKTIGPCPVLRRELPHLQSVAQFDQLVGDFLEELRSGKALQPSLQAQGVKVPA
jgi:tRNA-dihydrouridine synthase B